MATAVTIDLLYDPERDKPENGDWKPCLSFAETPSMLVINKTRAEQLSRLVKSPLLAKWAHVGQIASKPGIGNGKAQIIIQRPPSGKSLDELTDDEFNEELFG